MEGGSDLTRQAQGTEDTMGQEMSEGETEQGRERKRQPVVSERKNELKPGSFETLLQHTLISQPQQSCPHFLYPSHMFRELWLSFPQIPRTLTVCQLSHCS